MKFFSLFSGIGGFDLGFERSGMTCVGQCEIDPFCNKVLAKHWPNVWRHGDIKTLTGAMINEHCGSIDLICGGFPCQDISLAGKRAGMSGERSGLWSEFFRLICELRPGYTIIENVSALLIPTKPEEPAPLATVLSDLASLGFDAEWEMLRAADFGAPHQRDRLFIIANRDENKSVRTRESNRSNPGARFWVDIENFETWRGGFDKLESMGIAERGGSYTDSLRILDGIPDRMDRVGSLGNAVVPQVAHWIGRRIMAVPA